MKYILDTNVVSALRIPSLNPQVADRLAPIPIPSQYVTAFTIAELEHCIFARERTDAAQGAVLRAWFTDQVLPTFDGRVIPFDVEAARILARYRLPEHAPLDDALIAATAQAHSMVLVTRNVRHFASLQVQVVDPWTQDVV